MAVEMETPLLDELILNNTTNLSIWQSDTAPNISTNVSQLLLSTNRTNHTAAVTQINNRPQLDQTCIIFDFLIEAVFMGIMVIFGFTGNTLSTVCLLRDRAKTATPFLLISMGVADTLFLIAVLFLRVIPSIHTMTHWFNGLMVIYDYIGAFFFPTALVAQTGTIYLTVLVTVNRYISVCRPYEASDLCSIRHARRQVLIVTAFCIIYNLPRYFEFTTKSITHPETNDTLTVSEPTAMGENEYFKIIYGNILYFLIMFFIPLISLIIMNYRLILSLRQARMKRAQMCGKKSDRDSSKSEEDITLTLIVVVVIFLVCQLPAFITQLLMTFLSETTRLCPLAFFYYERISDFMVVANSSVNFAVYCFCSKRFRQVLIELVCKRKGEKVPTQETPQDTRAKKSKIYPGETNVTQEESLL